MPRRRKSSKRKSTKPRKRRRPRRINVRLAVKRARRRIKELLAEGAMKGVREERAYVKRLLKSYPRYRQKVPTVDPYRWDSIKSRWI